MNRLAETNVFNDLGRLRSAALRAEPVALSQAKPAAAIAGERTAAQYRDDAAYWRARHNTNSANALDERARELEAGQ